jgi:hypothetical protein
MMKVLSNSSMKLASGVTAVLWRLRLKHLLPVALVAVPLVATSAEAARREPGQPRGCPSKWCGCYLAHYYGMPHRKDLWRARNWAKIGKPTRPKIGAIVVWRNHVGVIVGKKKSGWVVKSGNDGNRVRVRVRTVHNAIAFRSLK